MVYLRLNDALLRYINIAKLETVEINKVRYVSFSSFKVAYPKLQLKEYVKSDDILSNLTIEEMQKPPPPPEHVKLMKQLQLKHDRRLYQKSMDSKKASKTYFQVTPDEGIRQMQKSISFGLTFIFSFFLAGVTGYLLGKYIFNLEHVKCMMLCVFFVIMTIVVQALLFVIRSNRMDRIKAQKDRIKEKTHGYVPSKTVITQQKKKQ